MKVVKKCMKCSDYSTILKNIHKLVQASTLAPQNTLQAWTLAGGIFKLYSGVEMLY